MFAILAPKTNGKTAIKKRLIFVAKAGQSRIVLSYNYVKID